ncbi:MAG: EAL domain-containing protein [Gammaproteobacteria bacterium]|nr:EAL domain-containing protein [Gammaproteobacteria bacterium]
MSASDDETTLNDAVVLVSADGTICSFHGKASQLSAESIADLPGSGIEALWPDELATTIRKNIRKALRNRQFHTEKFENSHHARHFEFVFVAQGRDRVLIIARDVSDQQDAISRMRSLAYTDKITGLPNREYLCDQLSEIMDSLHLKGGRAALICIEINDLELAINSSGKKNQDEILSELALRLTGSLRGANQFGEGDEDRYSIAARLDFRQFAVVLPDIETGTDAAGVASRLSDALQLPIKIGTREIGITVSAGIALYPQDGADAKTLIENACAAMEDAKNSQSERQKFHSGTLQVRALQRQDLALELQAALNQEGFSLNFQPIVRAADRNVTTVEALLRWPQAVIGSRSIQQVISVAEYTGMIIRLGEWILRRACEQLHVWHCSGYPELRLAVNLSAQEFSRSDLVQRIAAIIDESGVEPRFLDFEINEHVLFRDAMRDFTMCRQLKELGARLAVDDFGIGACSLANLSRSPVDAVKIDGSFVAHVMSNENDREACAAATAMAHKLNLEVTAESIETAEQATLLQQLGCDYLQGFLFFQPASASEFGVYLDHVPGVNKGGEK